MPNMFSALRSQVSSPKWKRLSFGFVTVSRLSLLLLPVLLLGAGFAQGADKPRQNADTVALSASFDKQIKPLLQRYCVSCHGATNPAAGVNLVTGADLVGIQRDQKTWRRVLAQVRGRSMPPARAAQPNNDQRDLLATWVSHALDSADDSLLPKDPGHIVLHRLSRTEYNNTVHDLFGVASNPADSFPADGGGGGGFDNNAATLFVPPILMERYLQAATEILDEAKPDRLFIARPSKTLPRREAARKTLTYQATRAYRRPVSIPELQRLLSLYDAATARGESYEQATKFALKAVLVSPNFLFRTELNRNATAAVANSGSSGTKATGKPSSKPDSKPPVKTDTSADTAYPISDYELASRLSYFLWASMPDDILFQLAGQNRLHTPAVLDAQVERMLKSSKAHAFADGFAGQWLKTRDLYTSAKPDPRRYPNFTPALRDAMYNETIAFFQSVVQEDSSLLTLIDSDYTFLNEDLAKHYGISGVTGPEMRRVSLADHRRGGVLTEASVLTLTSYPQRTSPVLRGKWVLSELLGVPPPPPPPVVATLPPDDAPRDGLTFRQLLEKHRTKPECAGCHARMDPIGFGLENFDATGRYREQIGGKKIDASGVLVSGEKFDGPIELKKLVLAQKDDFVRNITEKMLAYALGRGLEPYDLPAVRKITTALAPNNYRSTLLVREIVKSYPFQYRR